VRVVFDTNVLVSAMGWTGAPKACLDLARNGQVDGLTCLEILDELARVLEIKLGFDSRESVDAVTEMIGFLHVVPVTGRLHGLVRDTGDDMVVECALVGGASYVVTGDRDLLVLSDYEGIRMIRPVDFIALATDPIAREQAGSFTPRHSEAARSAGEQSR
jgi:uncharacterized protein